MSWCSSPRGMVVRGRARTLSRTATVLRCRAAGAAFGARLAVERGGGSVVGDGRLWKAGVGGYRVDEGKIVNVKTNYLRFRLLANT